MDDDVKHPTLGAFRWENGGWLGRSSANADFFDLFVMSSADTPPNGAAFALLERAVNNAHAMRHAAVDAICEARIARLNWRAGPSPELWSIIEARVDENGAVWLTLHEYETDEYSRWLVRVGAERGSVRRVPALALNGAPSEAGVAV